MRRRIHFGVGSGACFLQAIVLLAFAAGLAALAVQERQISRTQATSVAMADR
jgi:hypothetical protein